MSKVVKREVESRRFKITIQRLTDYEVTYQDDKQVWKQLFAESSANRNRDFDWVDNPNQEEYNKTEKESETIFEQVINEEEFKLGEIIKAVNYDNI